MQNLGVGYDTVLEETAASQAPNICPSRQVASLQARYDRQVCDLQRRGSVKMKTVVLKVFDSTIWMIWIVTNLYNLIITYSTCILADDDGQSIRVFACHCFQCRGIEELETEKAES